MTQTKIVCQLYANIIMCAIQLTEYMIYVFGNVTSSILHYTIYVLTFNIFMNIFVGSFQHIIYYVTYTLYICALKYMLMNISMFIVVCMENLDFSKIETY